MKRVFLVLTVLSVCLFAFGSFSYSKDGFSFDFLSHDTFFHESPFDPYSFTTKAGAFFFTDKAQSKLKIRLLGEDSNGICYRDFLVSDNPTNYTYLKTAAEADISKLTFDYENLPLIEFQVALKGYLDVMFRTFGSSECFGFDGSYLVSGELRFDKKYSLRFGMHHLSGHYGDEVLELMRAYKNRSIFTYESNGTMKTNYTFDSTTGTMIDGGEFTVFSTTEYVRDNEFTVGFSAELNDFTPYFVLSVPLFESYVRPFIHNTSFNKKQTLYLAWGEGLPTTTTEKYALVCIEQDLARDKSYIAARLSMGFDWKKDFDICKLYGGVNVQAYQDGQTKHEIGAYNKSNPWEFDITAGFGVEFAEFYGKTISIEVYDHYGRLPILNFYYERANIIFVGASIR